ncbi:preprotein translocase subunit SecG [Echinicola strongylocentroti]|uniref:Protein-export membrane protein SecG n=1 Tax=Echinicola strongylocentroti TaxID=1795355 RepID=A0A2Z4ILG8_9BACT|nr:preprotein translocase subunit SecG [Echinicola strongylocentroti]AWW31775.1 preprotein translocase subunit SecG [Echinicola strongylocentroti]
MFTLLISIIIVLAVILVLVILGQDSKGGVGAAFGGGASQIMGVTKTGNILEKATWVLAISLLILSLGTSAFLENNGGGSTEFSSPNIESAKEQMVAPSFGEEESILPSEDGNTEELSVPADSAQ